MTHAWEWLIGGFLVFLYAQSRFNTPKSNKTSTTLLRYYFASFAYFFSLSFLYVLMGGGITVSPQLLGMLTHGGEIPGDTKNLPGPLLSALILTTLLPTFPVLTKVDEWLKSSFQRIGNIPWEAARLAAKLRRCTFVIPEHLREKVIQELPSLSSDELHFEPYATLQADWAKSICLYVQIRSFTQKRKYDRFVDYMRDDYTQLQSSYERMQSRAGICMKLLSADVDDDAIRECKRNFREQLDGFYKRLCDFTARAILRCELTEIDRNKQLEKMGFSDLSKENEPLNIDQVVTISGVVFLVLLSGMVLLGSQLKSVTYIFFIAAMVATIYGIAVVAAVYPKIAWSFANIKKIGRRPVFSYVISGCIAVSLAFIVSLTFKFLWYQNFLHALQDIQFKYPWFLMSFIVALTTAACADNYTAVSNKEPTWLRWLEAFVTAASLSGAAWLVHRMLTGISLTQEIPGHIMAGIPELHVLLIMSALIGLVIGFLVPHWYRSASGRNVGPDEQVGEEQQGAGQLAGDAV